MVWIDLYCSSGRHRSVALSILSAVLMRNLQVGFAIAHLNGSRWREVKCGGRCDQCRMSDLQATVNAVRPIFGPMLVREFLRPHEPEIIEETIAETPPACVKVASWVFLQMMKVCQIGSSGEQMTRPKMMFWDLILWNGCGLLLKS